MNNKWHLATFYFFWGGSFVSQGINAWQKRGQRGKKCQSLVEMNVCWQPKMKTLVRLLTAPASADCQAPSLLQEFVSRLCILRQRKG